MDPAVQVIFRHIMIRIPDRHNTSEMQTAEYFIIVGATVFPKWLRTTKWNYIQERMQLITDIGLVKGAILSRP